MASYLTDIHTHILPKMDDGSESSAMSLELLKLQLSQHVNTMVFTPHYYYERQSIPEFLERREASMERLVEVFHNNWDGDYPELNAKLGAEVHYTPALSNIDFSPLAIEDTPYILIELSSHTMPLGAEQVFYDIRVKGYTPILAHVERYPYIYEDPSLLYNWVRCGCLAQVNGGALDNKFVEKLMGWNLIHVIASDAHNLTSRRPNLREELRGLPRDIRQYLINNAEQIYKGREVVTLPPVEPKKSLLGTWS